MGPGGGGLGGLTRRLQLWGEGAFTGAFSPFFASCRGRMTAVRDADPCCPSADRQERKAGLEVWDSLLGRCRLGLAGGGPGRWLYVFAGRIFRCANAR